MSRRLLLITLGFLLVLCVETGAAKPDDDLPISPQQIDRMEKECPFLLKEIFRLRKKWKSRPTIYEDPYEHLADIPPIVRENLNTDGISQDYWESIVDTRSPMFVTVYRGVQAPADTYNPDLFTDHGLRTDYVDTRVNTAIDCANVGGLILRVKIPALLLEYGKGFYRFGTSRFNGVGRSKKSVFDRYKVKSVVPFIDAIGIVAPNLEIRWFENWNSNDVKMQMIKMQTHFAPEKYGQ